MSRVSTVQEQGLTIAAGILDEDELAQAVKRTLLINEACKLICRVHGPPPDCHCKGDTVHCHAHVLWHEEGHAVILGLERMGMLK